MPEYKPKMRESIDWYESVCYGCPAQHARRCLIGVPNGHHPFCETTHVVDQCDYRDNPLTRTVAWLVRNLEQHLETHD